MARPKKTKEQKELQKRQGERLQIVRKHLNKKQSDFAEHYNLSVQAISNWETGLSEIPKEVFIDLSNTFDIDIDFLKCKTDDIQWHKHIEEWNKEVPRIQAEMKIIEYCEYLGCDVSNIHDEEFYSELFQKINTCIINHFQEKKGE